MNDSRPLYICRCQEVTEEEIIRAMEDGATTIKGVKIRTEAVMGLCQGRTCKRLIEKMLFEHKDVAEIKPSVRIPVRTVKIAEILAEKNVQE